MQKRVIRPILKLGYRDSTQPFYKQLGILKFTDITKYQRLIMAYKASHNNLPSNLNQIFKPISDTHDHATRKVTSGCVTIPEHRLKKTQFSIWYQAVREWNSILQSSDAFLTKAKTLSGFKTDIKKYIISRYWNLSYYDFPVTLWHYTLDIR